MNANDDKATSLEKPAAVPEAWRDEIAKIQRQNEREARAEEYRRAERIGQRNRRRGR